MTEDVKGTATSPSEDELIRRAVQRDAIAFGCLYERYLDRIYRYVFYRVSSASEAEDLTEQVFLKAWEAIDRYAPRGAPFSAWLYRLAHNLVVDHYRSQKATTSLEAIAETEDAGIDVLSDVEDSLEVEDVRAAIATLSSEQQQLIVLRFVEGLSHAETAQIIGKSEGATRVIQHRAVQALARALQANARGERDRSPRRLPG